MHKYVAFYPPPPKPKEFIAQSYLLSPPRITLTPLPPSLSLGNGPMNQAMNYRNIPFCYNFRDLDLSSLLMSSLMLGPEYLVRLSLIRFNIFQLVKKDFQSDDFGLKKVEDLKQDRNNRQNGDGDGDDSVDNITNYEILSKFFNEYEGPSAKEGTVIEEAFPNTLSELLLLFVNMVTEVPQVPGSEVYDDDAATTSANNSKKQDESTDTYLHVLQLKVRRALIHAISNGGSGGLKHSKVNEIVHKICGDLETRIDGNKILAEVHAMYIT
jgi:hypothetical protein